MVHLIYPKDPVHPKTRELADMSQFSRRTVREAADCLPEDDAVLDAAIGEAMGRRDIMGLLLLVCAALSRERPVLASTTDCCSVCNRTASRWWI